MSVTAPKGFSAAGIASGIKTSGALDLAVVVNEGPEHVAAAVTTPNRFAAAPIFLTRGVAARGAARAVVLNSGGANACTGERGASDAAAMADHAAAALGCQGGEVMVCSTGLIGSYLPMDVLERGIPAACTAAGPDGGQDAARAIMTTDTVPKVSAARGEFTVGAMAKGAGMLNPAMATMLAVVTTDASVTPALADAALTAAVDLTFNRLDADGCQSTNDTVILLASGASGVTPSADEFHAAVYEVCEDLAQQMLADAEGASHAIAVRVTGAVSVAAAELAARAVSSSNLVKAAIFGNDPNWGRILAAVGTLGKADCPFDPAKVTCAINGTPVFAAGAGLPGADDVDLTAFDVTIDIDLGAGDQAATIWTNDLTHAYVEENSAYSS